MHSFTSRDAPAHARSVEFHVASFAIAQNKLLCHALLKTLNISQAPILYGGFASHPLGDWPKFDALHMASVIERRLETHPNSSFIVKSVTNGGGQDVLIITPRMVQRFNGSAALVTQRVMMQTCAFLRRPYSEWGQRFEHRGVIVEDNAANKWASSYFAELKIHVVFGSLTGGGIYHRGRTLPSEFAMLGLQRVPQAGVHWDDDGVGCVEILQQPQHAESIYCSTVVLPLLRALSTRIQDIARLLANRLAADWFRLDAFILQRLDGTGEWPLMSGARPMPELVINEVSYPGNAGSGSLSLSHLSRHYDHYDRLELVDGPRLVSGLLRDIHVDANTFFYRSDFNQLQHTTEHVYAAARKHMQVKWNCTQVPTATNSCSGLEVPSCPAQTPECPSMCRVVL